MTVCCKIVDGLLQQSSILKSCWRIIGIHVEKLPNYLYNDISSGSFNIAKNNFNLDSSIVKAYYFRKVGLVDLSTYA